MDGLTAVPQRAPGRWQIADVEQIRVETPRTKTFRLRPPMWMSHLPGQHYDVRLTAPDGYRAERSYSIASSPSEEGAVDRGAIQLLVILQIAPPTAGVIDL